MADTNTLTFTYDKPSYNQGDKMNLTMGGTVTRTTPGANSTYTTSVVINLGDGSSITSDTAAVTIVAKPTTQDMAPKMTGIADPQRTWTISADGKTATAVA